jgi:glycosyltransferase involved in cell wall biosynthesis
VTGPANGPVRLAVVVNGFPSVSESFIFNKVRGLRDAGLDVTVVANAPSADAAFFAGRMADPPAVLLVPAAGGAARLPAALAGLVRRSPAGSLRLWKEIRARHGDKRRALRAWVRSLPLALGGFDVIHFEYSGLAVAYRDVLPHLAGKRIVVSCRGAAEQITPLLHPERADQLREVFAHADRVHCVSEDMLRTVEGYGLPRSKAFVNHPSIDAAQFRRREPYPMRGAGPYRLVSTGRLHWKKGFEYALLAVRRLVDEGADVRYDIIGGGLEEERLRFAVHDLRLDGRVRLLGRQPAEEVRRALEEADVYLLPSLSEGLSNAALEAMAMELPVVSTTAGGMEEAIQDGRDGFLVPSRDPAALAAAIRRLLASAELRRSMGHAARLRIEEHFNLARQIGCFVDEYRALAGGAPRTEPPPRAI